MSHRHRKFSNFRGLEFTRPKLNLSPETKQSIASIVLLILGIVLGLSLFDLAGTLGVYFNDFARLILGVLRPLAPVLLLLWGYFLLRPSKYTLRFSSYFGLVLFLLSFTGLVHLLGYNQDLIYAAQNHLGGGYAGLLFSLLFFKTMGLLAGAAVLVAFTVIALFLLFNTSFSQLSAHGSKVKGFWQKFNDLIFQFKIKKAQKKKEEMFNGGSESTEEPQFSSKEVEIVQEPNASKNKSKWEKETPEEKEEKELSEGVEKFKESKIDIPFNLLNGKTGVPDGGDIAANKLIIKKTLENFGIDVEMAEAQVGPTVTQYTLKPADGVKLSRITGLQNDLALALASHPIRIEAPIPGRSLVGIEVPNTSKAIVPLRDVIVSEQFKSRKSNLMVALGKDVMGRPWLADLKKMPHILIAGATNSGKSVCINSLILSFLFQNSPGDLKFILVDPKRVELPIYNGIPHLLTPVITDVKKTVNALRWAIKEMERRFEILSQSHKRNLESYNADMPEPMPYIVIVIDELADLMAAASAEVEAAIIRLAQMARAVGIHLVLATQRPSVDVLTGLIKANITARIAFSVASLVDSRTILDMSGAEKLLGRGDMLYISAELGKPVRLQGAFASDEEIKRVIDYLHDRSEPEYIDGIVERQQFENANFGEFDDSEGGDSLLGEAKEVIIQAKKASASLLQRRLRVGYARAARILDLLEQQGFIGPGDGAKPREVLGGNFSSGGPEQDLGPEGADEDNSSEEPDSEKDDNALENQQ